MNMIEFSDLMDRLLYPTKKYSRSISANRQLSADDIFTLYDFVNDFYTQKANFKWADRLKDVADIVYKYQPDDTDIVVVKNNDNADKIPKSFTMPFLIRQVLFCTAVLCHFDNLATQNEIVKTLSSYKKQYELANPQAVKKLDLSHNFFSRMNVTAFVDMFRYEQPELVFSYLGQKKEELGVAIKNLVYQAGDYNVFIDVFGGSGAASVAFPRRSNAVYIYNDLDEDLYNILDIILSDEDYLKLIEYIKGLQDDLRGLDIEWSPFQFDFEMEMKKFLATRPKKKTINEQRIIYDSESDVTLGVEDPLWVDDEFQKDNIAFAVDYMTTLYNSILKNQYNDAFLKSVFDDYGGIQNRPGMFISYMINIHKIAEFIELQSMAFNSGSVTYTNNTSDSSKVVNIVEFTKEANQLRFYEWFAIFSNVLNDKKDYAVDKVFLATAKIYLMQFTTNGVADISAILRIYRDSSQTFNKKQSNNWKHFLEKDFADIIKTLRSYLKKNDKLLSNRKHRSIEGLNRSLHTRTIIEQMDCVDLLDKYKYKNKVLIYSDSPYAATRQYKVGDFTPADMEKLLQKLHETKQKFIFSCRACVSLKKRKPTQDDRYRNNEIFESVFKKFKEIFKNKKLYVLTIAKNVDFWDLVRNNKVAELMITNYEIYGFTDLNYDSVTYKVYDYNVFKRLLDKNMNK